MNAVWNDVFDSFGVKTVSKTDKSRAAYVLNAAQVDVLLAAGLVPSSDRPAPGFLVQVLFDPDVSATEASFYLSARSTTAKRVPEPPMGHALISSWAQTGDKIIIGNIGKEIYAAKVGTETAGAVAALLAKASKARSNRKREIIAKALKAKGKPKRTARMQQDFVRTNT